LERFPGVTDEDWAAARDEFFGRFPRAKEIRIQGEGVLPTDCLPKGQNLVFLPGERLSLRVALWRKELRVRIAGVQMPLFGDVQAPSYMLEGGEEIYWNPSADRWMFKSGSVDLGIAGAARLRSRARRSSETVRAAA